MKNASRAKFPGVITHRSPENHDPITWVGRVPVYATTVLVALYVAAMIGVALMLAAGQSAALERFTFDSTAVLQDFELWRCFTYAFINPPDPWFIIALVMLYVFGRDVEQFLGRTSFLRLYAAFLLLGPVIMLALSAAMGRTFLLGHSWANLAVFLSFAALYPNAQLLFQIPAKVFAWVFLGLYVLQLLAQRQQADLLVLLATAFLAWYAVRHGAALRLDFLARLRPVSHRMRQPKLRVLPPPEEEPADPHGIIDPLLEKISSQGLASLTRREREQLQRARTALLAREKS